MRKRQESGPPLTIELINRIETLLLKKGWEKADLIERSGMAKRSVEHWLGGPARTAASEGAPRHIRTSNLARIARALGVEIAELFEGPAEANDRSASGVRHWFDIAAAVDAELLDITRRLSSAPAATVRAAYTRVLRDGLREHGLTLGEWVATLEDPSSWDDLLQALPEPVLEIDVDRNFQRVLFRLSQGGDLEVVRPSLLWDCACDTPDVAETPTLCPVHSSRLGTLVERAFSTGACLIKWRGLEFVWQDLAPLWPPSVDSFAFLIALERAALFASDWKHVFDLGSGTGFLGVSAGRFGRAEQVTLADWLLTPTLYGTSNWARNMNKVLHTPRLRLRVGLFTDWIEGEEQPLADLALCNPPYLPALPGFEALSAHAIVIGTELLEHLIETAPILGRRVFVQYSNLAAPRATAVGGLRGRQLVPVSNRARAVPFRVRSAWAEDPDYFQALRRIGLISKPNERHPYWHEIQAYEVIVRDTAGEGPPA